MTQGKTFKTRYIQSLTLFNHFNKSTGFGKRIVRAGIKPGKTTT